MPRDAEFEADYRPLRGHAEDAPSRPGTRRETVTWPWVLLAAVGVLAVCGVVGWLTVAAFRAGHRQAEEAAEAERRGEEAAGPKKVFPRTQFEELVIGRTPDAVTASVGWPAI